MATQFNFKELDQHKKSDYLEIRQAEVSAVKADIIRTAQYMTLETDLARWNKLITDLDKFSEDVYYYLASHGDTMPVESMIGAIAGLLNPTKDRDINIVIATNQTAGEIVMASQYITKTLTYTDRTIAQSTLATQDLAETEMYPLPNFEPSTRHKTLGRYNWTNTCTEALDKLNTLKFTVIDFDEKEPAKSANIRDVNELHRKWEVRNALRPKLTNKAIHFDWHSCYRGRMYAGGYHFNPQGTQYEKSILGFGTPEKMTDAGFNQLYLSTASAYGHDKQTDEWKLEWYLLNDNKLNWKYAKEPHTARKLEYAIKQAFSKAEATMIPVELDATNSQLQVVSVLTGSFTTAQTCNVVADPKGAVADAYQLHADMMSALAKQRGITGSSLDHLHTEEIEAGAKSDSETLQELDEVAL